MYTTSILIFTCVLIIIFIYYPDRHAKHYPYIQDQAVLNELQLDIFHQNSFNLKNCTYKDLILNSYEIEINTIYKDQQFSKPNKGGEFSPFECASLFKSAIVIPYRNRSQQLNTFLNYMHNFLQKQRITYRIFVVEQNNTLPFNRAMMMNYGAKIAMSLNFSCLILHDVDLIPINTGNIYACSKKPRHMSSNVDIFRYNLPYLSLFGGAVSISSEHFKSTNGMSNIFFGWGGEDDNFFNRLLNIGLEPYRFSPNISKYIMLFHKKEKASENRWKNLELSVNHNKVDGLNSLGGNYLILLKELYTHIVIWS